MSEVTVAVKPSWLDSNGKELQEGDRVHVAVALAEYRWDSETQEYNEPREWDFGSVEFLNEDGTVGVFWDSAGCSCNSENGREEKPSDLTVATPELEKVQRLAFTSGWNQGSDSAMRDVQETLGISDNTRELKALKDRLAALEQGNN